MVLALIGPGLLVVRVRADLGHIADARSPLGKPQGAQSVFSETVHAPLTCATRERQLLLALWLSGSLTLVLWLSGSGFLTLVLALALLLCV